MGEDVIKGLELIKEVSQKFDMGLEELQELGKLLEVYQKSGKKAREGFEYIKEKMS